MAGSPDSNLNKIDFLDPAIDLDAAYEQAVKEVPGLEKYGKTAFLDFVDEYRKAIPAVDEYKEHMQGIFDDLKQSNPTLFENAELQIGDIKSPKRALEKIVGDYGGDASKIGDLVRGRIVADTPEQIQTIREYISEHSDEIGIEKMKDRFAKPSDTGFRDINAKIGLADGVSAEFRVEHRDVMEAADHTHKPYERVQEIERQAEIEGRLMTADERAERQQILDNVRDIHGEPARAAGLDELLNEEGRARMAEHEAERLTPRNITPDASLDAARASAGLNAPDNMRPAASLTDNFASVAAEGVQEASRLARLARFGANAPVVGPAVGVGAAALTGFAHSGQRDYAEKLRNQNVLSDEAYEAYLELNSETETMLHADIGLSTVDPTGLSVVVTAGVEMRARGAFKDWADEHAPHLSEEQFQSLVMSMLPDNSARNEMIMEAVNYLPDSKEGQPEFMHDIIDAKNAYMETRAELARTPIGPGPRHGQLSDEVARMRQGLAQDMENMMSHPESIDAILDAVPVKDRMEYVRRLAASEDNLEQFSENHSQIAEYVQAHEDSLTGWFLKEDDILQENPDILNAYIKERSGISTETVDIADSQPSPDLGDFSGPDATYAGDPHLAAETAEAGISVNPALLPSEQIAAASNTFRPEIPQL